VVTQQLKKMSVNWRTTLSGVLQWFYIVIPQAQTMLDTDVNTNPDWNLVVLSTMTMIGLLQARDWNKSSEQQSTKG
jgi:hypothetical protein